MSRGYAQPYVSVQGWATPNYSFLTLVANKQLAFSVRLTEWEFVRTDDATKYSEETFTVSKTGHNLRKKF